MGTTLHGVVECYIEAAEHSRARWEDFATIEFNKYYPLQCALSEVYPDEKRNWLLPIYLRRSTPFEDSTTSIHHRNADVAERGGWVTTNELETIAEKLRIDEEGDLRNCTLMGTIAFMREMEKQFTKVRLLYYHM